jgi:plastocyanin
MNRRQFIAASAAAATMSVAGCAGGNDGGEGMETTTGGQNQNGGSEADATVTAVNTSFDPVRLEVEAGAVVEWTNQDGFGHDVTSAQFHDVAAGWDVAMDLPSGGTVSNTFDSEGVYEYYCSIHGQSNQCGVVLVGDVSLDEPLPCE